LKHLESENRELRGELSKIQDKIGEIESAKAAIRTSEFYEQAQGMSVGDLMRELEELKRKIEKMS